MDGGGYLVKRQADATKNRIDKMSTNEFWDRYGWAISAVPVMALLLFIMWSTSAEAQPHSVDPEGDECWAVGILIEVAEDTTDKARRDKQWIAWYRLANTPKKQRIVKYARNAFVSGVTSGQMYRHCAT